MTAKVRCPTCRRTTTKTDNKFYPLCSERCQLVDLGRWLNEEYRVPESDGSAASELTARKLGSDEE